MGDLKFKVSSEEKGARTGVLKLKHGTVKTPELMPVATKASVKALSSEELEELKVQLIICNTYHLMLRPGADVVEKLGGLHKFMNWKGPIVTDSGGFQAFSLGLGREHGTGKMYFQGGAEVLKRPEKSNARITDKGVYFRSIYDHSPHLLTPEKSIRIQEQLGADMILALDECTSPLSDKKYVAESLERTHRWAQESIDAHKTRQALAGIIQGSQWKDLREKSAKYICSLPFDSIAIGGSLGKSKKDLHNILGWIKPYLPDEKPRHLLGIGVVEDLFESVYRGMDLFDCVSPTRMARAGFVYVSPPLGNRKNKYKYKIAGASFRHDNKPVDPNCKCRVCRNYSRAYINHLFKANELLAYSLTSYHNIHFFMQLMRDIRDSIDNSKFGQMRKKWGFRA